MKLAAGVLCLLGFFAWAEAPKNLLKPINKVESWRFEMSEAGKGSVKAVDDTVVFTVTETTGTDWHVQAVQTDLDLLEGKEYTLTFQAKADSARSIGVNAMIDKEDWHQIGLGEEAFLGKEYDTLKYTFRAENVLSKKNRISVVLGGSKGTVTIKGMTLTGPQ
ncbi:MAG: carbohydrate binding domain-containing protein [Planctomycetota bacterium]